MISVESLASEVSPKLFGADVEQPSIDLALLLKDNNGSNSDGGDSGTSGQIKVGKAPIRGPDKKPHPTVAQAIKRVTRASYFDRTTTEVSFENIEDRKTRLVGAATCHEPRPSQIPSKVLAVGPCTVYVAIVLSAVALGVETEIPSPDWFWRITDHVFTFVFAAEMVVMLRFWKMAYFHSRWNCMDFLLAWFMIIETWIIPLILLIFFHRGGDVEQFSFLRIIRLVRPLRVIKLLKMKRELTVVVEGIGASLRSMFWISVMLFLMIYACGIFCVHITASADYARINFDRHEHFGTVLKSMLTLFSMTILTEWPTVIRPVAQVQPYIVPFFMLFVIFTSFGIMNVIIGVIVERTTAKAHEQRAEDLARVRKEQEAKIEELCVLLGKLDVDGDQRITLEEVEKAEFSDALKGILNGLKLPRGFKPSELHTMLDLKGTGMLSSGEFIDGMFRLLYCDTFQHTCLVQLSVATLGKRVREAFKQLVVELEFMLDEMREEMGLLPLSSPPGVTSLSSGNRNETLTNLRSQYSSDFSSIQEYALLDSPDCALQRVGKSASTSSDLNKFGSMQSPSHFSLFPSGAPKDCDTPFSKRQRRQRRLSISSSKSNIPKLESRIQQLEEEISKYHGQTTNMVQQLNVKVVAERYASGDSGSVKIDCANQANKLSDDEVQLVDYTLKKEQPFGQSPFSKSGSVPSEKPFSAPQVQRLGVSLDPVMAPGSKSGDSLLRRACLAGRIQPAVSK